MPLLSDLPPIRYGLLIAGIVLIWSAGIYDAYYSSANISESRNRKQFETDASGEQGVYGRVLLYPGMASCIIGSVLITLRSDVYRKLPLQCLIFFFLFTYSIYNTFYSDAKVFTPYDLRCDFGAITVLAYGLIFVGYDPKAWAYSRYTFTCLSYLTVFAVIPKLPGLMTLSPELQRLYFTKFISILALIACSPIITVNRNINLYTLAYRSVPLLFLLLLSFLTISRGWIVLSSVCVVFIMWYYKAVLKHYVVQLVYAFGITGLVLFLLFHETVGQTFTILLDRIQDDTRSNQYEALLSQIDLSSLIFGGGLFTKYTFFGIDYGHFDNQFVTMIFKMGLFFVIGYMYLMVYPALRSIQHRAYSGDVYDVMSILVHLFACLGLSVFYSLSLSLPVIVVAMCAGHIWYELDIHATHRYLPIKEAA